MLKRVFRFLLGLLVLTVVGLVVLWLYLDQAAARALTGGIRYAGDVPCTVQRVSVSPLDGHVLVAGLAVSNPGGYSQCDILTLQYARLEADMASLWGPPVRVELAEVLGPVVRIEPGPGGTNVQTFVGNCRRRLASPEQRRGQTRLKVNRLVIRQAVVQLAAGPETPVIQVELPPVELTNLHGPDGKGVTPGELAAAIVLETVRHAAARSAEMQKLLPAESLQALEAPPAPTRETVEKIDRPLERVLPLPGRRR